MSKLVRMIEEAKSEAPEHAECCKVLLKENGLAEAMVYCKKQRIEPPQCSLTAESPNANKMRATAERMLSEEKWWRRRLESRAGQEFELQQLREGKVTNIISDESLEYYLQRNKR